MLPGLDRLIAVCQRHSLPMTLSPPLASAPQWGEPIFGEPLDPQLAALYQYLGAAEFGQLPEFSGPITFSGLALYGPGSDEEGLIRRNEWLRENGEVPYLSSLVFGWEPGFAFYYGVVPRLAGTQGPQPVVHICAMETLYAIPVASSVDRFFDLYASYLELATEPRDFADIGVHFPLDVQHLIAQDAPLMEQVRAGRFDFLTNSYRDALEWLQQLRASAP
jgi:hypothetical protein